MIFVNHSWCDAIFISGKLFMSMSMHLRDSGILIVKTKQFIGSIRMKTGKNRDKLIGNCAISCGQLKTLKFICAIPMRRSNVSRWFSSKWIPMIDRYANWNSSSQMKNETIHTHIDGTDLSFSTFCWWQTVSFRFFFSLPNCVVGIALVLLSFG